MASSVVTLLVFGVGTWFLFGVGAERRNLQAVSDAVTHYNATKQSGTLTDVCIHAGLVSAAYERANDQANYTMWKAREAEDCVAAGAPRH